LNSTAILAVVKESTGLLSDVVSLDRTRVTSLDWESYLILTFPHVPKVEVHLIDRPVEKPLASGEASSAPAAAAITNAAGSRVDQE
jgi:nicotinate dehydrogenase subunit B